MAQQQASKASVLLGATAVFAAFVAGRYWRSTAPKAKAAETTENDKTTNAGTSAADDEAVDADVNETVCQYLSDDDVDEREEEEELEQRYHDDEDNPRFSFEEDFDDYPRHSTANSRRSSSSNSSHDSNHSFDATINNSNNGNEPMTPPEDMLLRPRKTLQQRYPHLAHHLDTSSTGQSCVRRCRLFLGMCRLLFVAQALYYIMYRYLSNFYVQELAQVVEAFAVPTVHPPEAAAAANGANHWNACLL